MSFPSLRSALTGLVMLFNVSTDEGHAQVLTECEWLMDSYRQFSTLSDPAQAGTITYRWQNYQAPDPLTGVGYVEALIVEKDDGRFRFLPSMLNNIRLHMGAEEFDRRIIRSFPDAAEEVQQRIVKRDPFFIHPARKSERCFYIA